MKIVCVPYFLGPGRHASVDVPNLIEESRVALRGEGLLLKSSRRSRPGGGRTGGSGGAAEAADYVEGGGEGIDDDDDEYDDEDGEIPILVSDALGSHLEGMLGAVGDLVERALNEHRGDA